METTQERIKKLIEKINENTDENSSKSEKEVRNLLDEIDDELVEIEENAKKEQKEVVSKKVEELRGEVDKISKKWKWGRVKDILEEDIKSGLEALKSEIEELEKPLQVVPFGGGENSLVLANRTESEELVVWRKLGQSPEQVGRNINELIRGLLELKENHDGFQKNFQEVAKTSNSDSLVKLSDSVTQAGLEYVKLGSKVGGWFPGLGQVGGLIGAGIGVTHGFTAAGMTVYSETLNVGAKHIEHHADNAEKLAEKVLENFNVLGVGKGIADSLGESISSTEKAKVNAKVAIAKEETKARVERIKDLEKQLEELRKEKDNQIKELKADKEKQIKRLEEEIDELKEERREFKEKIKKLEAKVDTSQERLLVAEIEVNRSRAPSPNPN